MRTTIALLYLLAAGCHLGRCAREDYDAGYRDGACLAAKAWCQNLKEAGNWPNAGCAQFAIYCGWPE